MDPLKNLEAQIEKYLNSRSGKEAINKAIASSSISGISGMIQGVSVNKKELSIAADEMKQILIDRLKDSGLEGMTQYISRSEIKSDPMKGMFFEITVPSFALRRDSLYPEKYPDGAYNIITLFEKGWSTNKSVWGIWHGERTIGKKKRDPDPILNDAVIEFNSRWSSRGLSAVVSMKSE